MNTLGDLGERWQRERPYYKALCKQVKNDLSVETRARSINCHISARTKDTHSLIKKAIRKSYDDPLAAMNDKAGVRVVCTYRDSLAQVGELIDELFHVCHREDKNSSLAFDQFGYSGIHFDIQLQTQRTGRTGVQDLHGLTCEVQVMTRAQSLWADISHELAYKPSQEPPKEIKRLIHLQSALIEIFDNQIAEARRVTLNLQEFPERRMLSALDVHFLDLTTKEYDQQLSLHILENMLGVFSKDELDKFQGHLDAFIERHRDTINVVFEDYADDDGVTPLLFQPESLLIFMCMERDLSQLKETWIQFLPLEDLADIWGVPLGTTE